MTEHDNGAAPTDGPDDGTGVVADDVPTTPGLPAVPAVICLGDFLPGDPAVATRFDHVGDGTRPLVGTLLPVHRLDRRHRAATVTLLAGTPLAAGAGPLVAALAAPASPRRTSTPATAAAAGRSGARATGRRLRRPPGSVAAGVVGLVGAAAVLTSLVWAGLAPAPASSDVVVEAAPTADRLPTVDGAVPTATPPTGTGTPGPTAADTARSDGTAPGALTGPTTSSPVPTPSGTRPVDGAPATVTPSSPSAPTSPTTTTGPSTTTTATTTPEVSAGPDQPPVTDPTGDTTGGTTEGTTEGTTGTGETAGEPAPGAEVQESPTSGTDEWLVLAGLGGLGLGLGSAGRHRAASGRHRPRARHRAPHATTTTRSTTP